ncbi:hypothetical protein X737_30175 [Mesorhizobium sp. L48C026A00]|nr:hypothetical protein X737_30175 [Mesorhizobium sp. L48C026A00]
MDLIDATVAVRHIKLLQLPHNADSQSCLFRDFAYDGLFQGLPGLHAAAGECPAPLVGWMSALDQQEARVFIKDHGARRQDGIFAGHRRLHFDIDGLQALLYT